MSLAKRKSDKTEAFEAAQTRAEPLTVELRPPQAADGESVFRLVGESPPLDPNSLYCNLLQCSHFQDTSVAAVSDGKLVGFVSGYRLPARPQILFIWQVVVAEQARGQGLATRMLMNILNRQRSEVTGLETTITRSNRGSWSLFEGLAEKLSTELKSTVMFDRELHFKGSHETEMLVSIGPFGKKIGAIREFK